MKWHTTLLGFFSLALTLLFASLSLAEDTAPPAAGPGNSAWCKENPDKCAELRAKHEALCKENPEKCEQMKQRRAERAEFCKQNPEKCAEQRERFQQRRAEMKAKCDADPAKCEQMKQKRRERFMQRHGGAAPPDAPGGNPPAASPAEPKP